MRPAPRFDEANQQSLACRTTILWQAIQSVERSVLPVHSMPTHCRKSYRRQSSHLPQCRLPADHGDGNTTTPGEVSDWRLLHARRSKPKPRRFQLPTVPR